MTLKAIIVGLWYIIRVVLSRSESWFGEPYLNLKR